MVGISLSAPKGAAIYATVQKANMAVEVQETAMMVSLPGEATRFESQESY